MSGVLSDNVGRSGGLVKAATSSSGLTFINSTDISDAATYAFTAVDASSYDGYGLFLQNIVPATDQVLLEGRSSSNGGSSYDSGASDYSHGREFWGISGQDTSDDSILFLQVGTSYSAGSAANEPGVSGWIWIFGPHLTGYTTFRAGLVLGTSDGYIVPFAAAAARLSAADVDAFQLFYSSGNIETGTITVYGLANS
jgi:hypothetical protein